MGQLGRIRAKRLRRHIMGRLDGSDWACAFRGFVIRQRVHSIELSRHENQSTPAVQYTQVPSCDDVLIRSRSWTLAVNSCSLNMPSQHRLHLATHRRNSCRSRPTEQRKSSDNAGTNLVVLCLGVAVAFELRCLTKQAASKPWAVSLPLVRDDLHF